MLNSVMPRPAFGFPIGYQGGAIDRFIYGAGRKTTWIKPNFCGVIFVECFWSLKYV